MHRMGHSRLKVFDQMAVPVPEIMDGSPVPAFPISCCIHRVAACPDCKMPASNLARVFGPTIVGYSSANPTPLGILNETKQQPPVSKCYM
jgi:hypothetical protein